MTIIEEIDSNGKSRFYPLEKGLLWGHNKVFKGDYGDYIHFDTYKEAEEWVCYKHTVETKVHEVNCE